MISFTFRNHQFIIKLSPFSWFVVISCSLTMKNFKLMLILSCQKTGCYVVVVVVEERCEIYDKYRDVLIYSSTYMYIHRTNWEEGKGLVMCWQKLSELKLKFAMTIIWHPFKVCRLIWQGHITLHDLSLHLPPPHELWAQLICWSD